MRPAEHEVTDEAIWRQRRDFIKRAGLLGLSGLLPGRAFAGDAACVTPGFDIPDDITPAKLATRYNNYYEFSPNKKVVYLLAMEFNPSPWTITVDGEVENPATFDIEDLTSLNTPEERIYRFRCVEGWSMVVPWNGFPLCKLLRKVAPTSKAKYVEFLGVQRPEEMISQRQEVLDWPYREGLRIDEAMHPLTFMATGMYGKTLPAQNGAPLRLVVPWKYGYKSIKAVTHIRLVEKQPIGSWQRKAPSAYDFLGNVNPRISHPRWSQRRENRLGELKKRRTLMLNGYAEQVAGLYRSADLGEHR